MLVIGLLLYIAALLILIQVNVYVTLGFIFVTSIIMKNIFPQLKGYIGEKRIRKLLHNLGDEYTAFNDMYVPKKDGKMTQIDHVLLSPYGIFVIETKNYTGWIFGQEQQKNWTQTIYNKGYVTNDIEEENITVQKFFWAFFFMLESLVTLGFIMKQRMWMRCIQLDNLPRKQD